MADSDDDCMRAGHFFQQALTMGCPPSSHHAGMSHRCRRPHITLVCRLQRISVDCLSQRNTQVCPPPLTGSAGITVDCLRQLTTQAEYELFDFTKYFWTEFALRAFHRTGQWPRPTHSGLRGKSEPQRKHPQCWRQTLPLATFLFQPETETSSVSAAHASVARKYCYSQVSLVQESADSTTLLSRAA